MNKLFAYLRYRRILFLFYLIVAAATLGIQYLSNQNMAVAHYIVLVISFFLLLLVAGDVWSCQRRRRVLEELEAKLYHATRVLPEADNALEARYIHMLADLGSAYDALKSRLADAHGDSLEYYTLWVHQIKTPIAAMGLVLSKMEGEEAGVIRQELFKIERYVDMVLRYIKLSDISSDLVIEPVDLGRVVHGSVKKFGILFVYQKLPVEIEPIEKTILSDKRWLGFILEQLISNALKYTHKGGVRIYMRNGALVVQDSGIGIRPEDLPRIFTRGFTGFNGRTDGRASGIGLHLAKKAADALHIALNVESRVGVGTSVSLTFPDTDTDMFK